MAPSIIKSLVTSYTEPGGNELLRQRDENSFFIPLACVTRETLAHLGDAIADALNGPATGVTPPPYPPRIVPIRGSQN